MAYEFKKGDIVMYARDNFQPHGRWIHIHRVTNAEKTHFSSEMVFPAQGAWDTRVLLYGRYEKVTPAILDELLNNHEIEQDMYDKILKLL